MTDSAATLNRKTAAEQTPHKPTLVPQPVQVLSLTKAAEVVSMSTSTIRRAIRRKELDGRKDENGDYKIRIDKLLQFQSDRDKRQARKERHSVASTATDQPTQDAAPQATQDAPELATGSADTVATELLAENAQLRIEAATMSSENRYLRDRVRDIGTDRDHWRTMATTSADSVKLLTDQRELVTQGITRNRRALRIVGMVGLLSLLVAAIAGMIWRPELKQLWLHLTGG